jgi:hypothetical protein
MSLLLSAKKQRFDIDQGCSQAIGEIYAELGSAMRRAFELRMRCAEEWTAPDPILGVEGMINILFELEEDARRMRATMPEKSKRNPAQLAVARAAAKELQDQLTRWEMKMNQANTSNKPDAGDA